MVINFFVKSKKIKLKMNEEPRANGAFSSSVVLNFRFVPFVFRRDVGGGISDRNQRERHDVFGQFQNGGGCLFIALGADMAAFKICVILSFSTGSDLN